MPNTGAAKKKIVRLSTSLPAHLTTPRTIWSLDDVHPAFWIGDEFLPLLVPADMPHLPKLLRAGASQSKSGAPILRKGTRIDFQALDDVLPFVAKQTIVPRCGDAIPGSSWGSNLHNLLVPAYWERLRQQTFAKTGGHCEICGWWNGLECHELWEYHEPIPGLPDSVCGVQRLVRLMPLCTLCHETHHLGLASTKGRLQVAGDRLRAYNRYTFEETREYIHLNEETWERRSQRYWALDLSCVAPGPLVVQSKWRKREDGVVIGKMQTGESVTILLGVAWQSGKELYPALPIEFGYCE